MVQLLLAIIYLAFVSLGLPDSLLGSAWPIMYGELDVPISYAGILSMIIAAGTVVASLMSDRLTRKFGTGMVTFVSVAISTLSMFGFSLSTSFLALCLLAVPYGLAAGSVDASLNNYVALHYASRHMSWLHCMWGIGASVGPYVMGLVLTGGGSWNSGYRYIGLILVALTAVLLISLPLWKKNGVSGESGKDAGRALSLKEVISIPGSKEIMLAFFCYSALEQTTGLWGSSYLALCCGVEPERAASYASMFFIGITVGRALSGFLTMLVSDKNMIRLGSGIITIGVAVLALPFLRAIAPIGLVIIGFGCAPVYPCIIHSTPEHFGQQRSQAIIGVQMASAYIGTCLMPPLFGLIADYISISLLPLFLALSLGSMALMHERLVKKTAH